MTVEPDNSLSASLEDYLEVILWSVAADGAARVRDIARQLQVQASSVTGALQVLAQKRFIHYRPYEAVTLTPEGFEEAARVVQYHRILREFFTDVLGVAATQAEAEACRVEHSLSRDVVCRLAAFLEYVRALPQPDRDALAASVARVAARAPTKDRSKLSAGRATLADLEPGHKAVVIRIDAPSGPSRQLADMGLNRGVLVEVEAVAPLGDPMRLRVRAAINSCYVRARRGASL